MLIMKSSWMGMEFFLKSDCEGKLIQYETARVLKKVVWVR